MEESEIRQIFEEIDPEGKISQGQMEELIIAIKNNIKNPPKDGERLGDYTVSVLKDQLLEEQDWRKKASIAAKIISMNLE